MTTGHNAADFLKDVVAFVEVWSSNKTENYSKTFAEQLVDMGALVSKTFNKQVTHVVFKDGHHSTWKKAKKTGVKLVSVLWVQRCKESGQHVDEDLCPAVHEETTVAQALNKRTHRCMQPRDIEERTPENDKRMQRKLNRMIQDLNVPKSPIVDGILPIIFDYEGAIVYSPTFSKRGDAMEQRLKEMKERRENISPTASQMESNSSYRPSVGESPSISVLQTLEEQNEDLNSSFDDIFSGSVKKHEKGRSCRKSTAACDTNQSMERPRLSETKKSKRSSVKIKVEKKRSTSLSNDGLFQEKPCEESNKQKSPEERNKTVFVSVSEKDTVSKLPPVVNCIASPDISKTDPKQSCSIDFVFKKKERVSNKLGKSLQEPLPYTPCKRKKDSLLSVLRSPRKSVNSTPSEDDRLFDDYFSPGNIRESRSHVRRTSLVNLPPEPVSFPTFVLEEPPGKRKRTTKETNDSTNSKLKRGSRNRTQKTNADVQQTPLNAPDDLNLDTEHPLFCEPEARKETGSEAEASSSRQRKRCGNQTSAGDQSDSISQMFSRPKDTCYMKTGKMEKNKKVSRTIVMTSMPSEKQNMVIQVVNNLGGFSFADTVCESTTHVVTGYPRRTLNVLLGIARGCWILSFEWILWCLEHGQWIPEEPYELSDHFPAAPICRLQQHLSAGEHQQDLFASQPAMFVSPLSQPPCHSLAELILLCGGKVCKTVRQAGICIGHYRAKKAPGTQSLSEQWILDCITHLKQLPYESYLLQ
ncbi:microcephalin [Amia ocellicauda]|uniref:microcephalin n=1 Tax=Amia ocellicauda TaxID=2972642 RepID=UPI003463860B